MRRTSESRAAAPQWEVVSASIFAALLLLYPPRFRRIYGAQMTLAFRASLREAARQGGMRAVARMWRLTLGDIVVTALAERLEKDVSISHSTLYRATGMISLAGVALWILGGGGFVIGTVLALRMGMSPARSMGATIGLPVTWLFFAIGFYGLYTRLAEARGAVVWWAGGFIILLLIALAVGSIYNLWASMVGVTYSGSAMIVNTGARGSVNEMLDSYAYDIMNLAYPLMGLAMLVTAWLTRREAALRFVYRMLIALGALSVIYYFFTDMGAPSLLRNTTPGEFGMMAAALIYFASWMGCWVALGLWLYRQGTLRAPAAVVAPSGDEAAAQ